MLLVGVAFLSDGIASVAAGLRGRFWQSTLIGVVSILAGLATFFSPGLTAMALLYVIAFWAIVRGAFEILAAIEFRKVIEGEVLLGLAGLLSIAFGCSSSSTQAPARSQSCGCWRPMRSCSE